MEQSRSLAPEHAGAQHSTNDIKGENMTIASFAVPERVESKSVDQARERLGLVGVVSYVVELAGSGEPVLDVDGATYVGEGEIQAAVDDLVSERQ